MGRPGRYPAHFREQAVELVKANPAKTVAEVARDLGLNDTTLGNWAQAERAKRHFSASLLIDGAGSLEVVQSRLCHC